MREPTPGESSLGDVDDQDAGTDVPVTAASVRHALSTTEVDAASGVTQRYHYRIPDSCVALVETLPRDGEITWHAWVRIAGTHDDQYLGLADSLHGAERLIAERLMRGESDDLRPTPGDEVRTAAWWEDALSGPEDDSGMEHPVKVEFTGRDGVHGEHGFGGVKAARDWVASRGLLLHSWEIYGRDPEDADHWLELYMQDGVSRLPGDQDAPLKPEEPIHLTHMLIANAERIEVLDMHTLHSREVTGADATLLSEALPAILEAHGIQASRPNAVDVETMRITTACALHLGVASKIVEDMADRNRARDCLFQLAAIRTPKLIAAE